jgi:hypothetical protein
MKNFVILVLITLGLASGLFAQEKSRRELKGDKYFAVYYFDKAIKAYSNTRELSTEGQRRLARSYQNLNMNVEAEQSYQLLVNGNIGVVPEDIYNYAMVLRINGKTTESDRWMEKFASLMPNDLRVIDYLAHRSLRSDLVRDMGKYTIRHLNFNSNALEFGTSYYRNDKIVFASTRSKSRMISRNYNWTGRPYWNLHVSDIDGEQLGKPELFSRQLSGRLNDGPASFNLAGDEMAYTSNNYNFRKSDKSVALQIFFSRLADDKWLPPTPFHLNSPDYSTGHPFLTMDGNTMYFSSDMPGGFGGADLYKCTRDANGVWGNPVNLGPEINTEGNEMFPFFDEKEHKLYFSSDGRFGLGGLDIFYCTIVNNQVGPVSNMGYPINSQHDDFAYIVNSQVGTGYFSSNRPGGTGGDDIYSVRLTEIPVVPVIPVTPIATKKQTAVDFFVYAPENIPVERKVREYFPLRNYVFFEKGSTAISNRYVKLKKSQVADFKEDQLEVFTPLTVTGRSSRQMIVYYNVLNILGDRLGKAPGSTIRLVGSSAEGPEQGVLMAESVKAYLVDVFGIDGSRITTVGRNKPQIPSEQVGGVSELLLLREEDERVSIESDSPVLLMEFLSGPDAPLRPVEILAVQEAPLDSYVIFNVPGANIDLNTWSLEITDDKGHTQYLGPYNEQIVGIPGKTILGSRPSGLFKVLMIGKMKDGTTVLRDTTVQVVLWTPHVQTEAMRFSVIYEFDDAQAIRKYEKYLTEVLSPRIPIGASVMIYGYTDVIGDANHNLRLSLARANDVKLVLSKAQSAAGRSDVKFFVHGLGEDPNLSQFENNSPEGRFYNRTVIIDIVPKPL